MKNPAPGAEQASGSALKIQTSENNLRGRLLGLSQGNVLNEFETRRHLYITCGLSCAKEFFAEQLASASV